MKIESNAIPFDAANDDDISPERMGYPSGIKGDLNAFDPNTT